MKALQKWYLKNGMGQLEPTSDLDEKKSHKGNNHTNSFQPWEGDIMDDDDAYEADERVQR